MNLNEKVLDVSWGTIIKVFIIGILFYTIYLIRDILIWMVFAVILSILFAPIIDFLEKIKVPRVAGVVISYFSVFALFGALIYFIVPIFITELQKFLLSFPSYLGDISNILRPFGIEISDSTNDFFYQVRGFLQERSSGIISSVMSFFGGISSAFLIFTIAMFLSMEKNPIQKALMLVFPKKYEKSISYIWLRCKSKVTNWFAVRIIGMIFVGITSYISFAVIGVKYPLTMAILTGVLDFIPVIGPLVGGFIVFLVTFPESLFLAIVAILIIVLIQFIENNILIPVLSDKFIGIPSVLVIISLVIGQELFGLMGAILFVPLSAIIYEFVKEFLEQKKLVEEPEEQKEIRLPLK